MHSTGLVVGHAVTLMADGQQMTGRIAETRAYDGLKTSGAILLIRLDNDAGCPKVHSPLVVQFNTTRGSGHMAAYVTAGGGVLMEVELTGEIAIENRRATVRLDVDLPCQVVTGDGVVEGQLTNLSLGGGQLVVPGYTPEKGAPIEVRFGVGGGPAALTGRVLWAEPANDESDTSVRICWRSVPAQVEGRMARYINARLREIYKGPAIRG